MVIAVRTAKFQTRLIPKIFMVWLAVFSISLSIMRLEWYQHQTKYGTGMMELRREKILKA